MFGVSQISVHEAGLGEALGIAQILEFIRRHSAFMTMGACSCDSGSRHLAALMVEYFISYNVKIRVRPKEFWPKPKDHFLNA